MLVLGPLLALAIAGTTYAADEKQALYLIPNVSPGVAKADHKADEYTLSNNALSVTWSIGRQATFAPIIDNGFLENKLASDRISIGLPFQATTVSGEKIWPFGMKLKGQPKIEKIVGTPLGALPAGRFSGQSISATLEDASRHLEIEWKVILLDESNYIRQEITITTQMKPLTLKRLDLIQTEVKGASAMGLAQNSPLATDDFFFAAESEGAVAGVDQDVATCSLEELTLPEAKPVTYSSVVGVAPKDQLRRAFLNYVDRERNRPRGPFGRYASWYAMGYFAPHNGRICLEAVNRQTSELEKRGEESLQWWRANSDVLVDSHWIGGDPRTDVYGWAAWSSRKGLLTLRNPSARAQSISIDVQKAFELPGRHPKAFVGHSPWADDASKPTIKFTPGKKTSVTLQPNENIVLEAIPQR